jgi:MMPL family
MPFLAKYVAFLQKFRFATAAIWFIIAVLGGIAAPQMMQKTTQTIGVPPQGSMSQRGIEWLDKNTKNGALVPLSGGTGPQSTCTLFYSKNGDDLLSSKSGRNATSARICSEFKRAAYANVPAGYVQVFESYYQSLEEGLPVNVSRTFVSRDGSAMIVPMVINNRGGGPDPVPYVTSLQARVEEITTGTGVSGQILGLPSFMASIQKSVERDVLVCDGSAIPLALLVMAVMVQSLRLLIVPILTLLASGAMSFGIMYFPTTNMPIVAMALSLMSSVVVAISLDYSLFLLSRFKEALEQNRTPVEAVEDMLHGSGHTILVSGATLATAFFGLMIIPLNSVFGMGLAAGVAVCCLLLGNLILFPTIILLFPNFFARSRGSWRIRERFAELRARLSGKTRSESMHPHSINDGSEALLRDDALTPTEESMGNFVDTTSEERDSSVDEDFAANEASYDRRLLKSRWYKMGKLITRRPWNIIMLLVVAAATAPFAYFAFGFPVSAAIVLGLDRFSNVTDSFTLLTEEFGYGYLMPYTVIVEPADGTPLLSEEFFSATRSIVSEMSKLDYTSCKNFTTLSQVGCTPVPLNAVKFCLQVDAGGMCKNLNRLYNATIVDTPKGVRGMLIKVLLNIDPIGKQGDRWYEDALVKVSELESSTAHVKQILLSGGAAWDMINYAYVFVCSPFLFFCPTRLLTLLFHVQKLLLFSVDDRDHFGRHRGVSWSRLQVHRHPATRPRNNCVDFALLLWLDFHVVRLWRTLVDGVLRLCRSRRSIVDAADPVFHDHCRPIHRLRSFLAREDTRELPEGSTDARGNLPRLGAVRECH